MEQIIDNILNPLFQNPNWDKVMDLINKNSSISVVDRKNRAKLIAELLGFNLLGHGSFRMTLDVEDYAVKIPIQGVGFYDNKDEAEIWHNLPNDAKPFFAAYLGKKNGINVYEKAKLLKKNEFDINHINKIVRELEVLGVEIEDHEGFEQWGYVNNKLLLLDYTEVFIYKKPKASSSQPQNKGVVKCYAKKERTL